MIPTSRPTSVWENICEVDCQIFQNYEERLYNSYFPSAEVTNLIDVLFKANAIVSAVLNLLAVVASFCPHKGKTAEAQLQVRSMHSHDFFVHGSRTTNVSQLRWRLLES